MEPLIIGLILLLVTLVLFYRAEKHITFHKELRTILKPEVVWKEFEKAIKDSSTSEFWPDVEILKSDGLAKGNDIRATQKIGKSSNTYIFTIVSVDKGSEFTYSTKEHEFEGSAIVKVSKYDDGAKILWSGSYSYRGFSLAALRFKGFQKKFFAQMKKNIRNMEY